MIRGVGSTAGRTKPGTLFVAFRIVVDRRRGISIDGEGDQFASSRDMVRRCRDEEEEIRIRCIVSRLNLSSSDPNYRAEGL